jgi:AraC-like DNA-binding protein
MQYKIEAELVSAQVRAQVRSCYWTSPDETIETVAQGELFRTIAATSPLRTRDASGVLKIIGSLGFIPAQTPVCIHSPMGRSQGLVCAFQAEVVEEITGISCFWDDDNIPDCLNLKSSLLNAIMQRIQDEVLSPGFASQVLLDSASNIAHMELAQCLRHKRADCAQQGLKGLTAWQLRRIRERVQAIDELGNPALKELATLCGISQSHMMRSFKISTGTTLHKHIEQTRLQAAKQLLMSGQLSNKEIAFKLGFSTSTYFSAAFRRLSSMTPTDFRTWVRSI